MFLLNVATYISEISELLTKDNITFLISISSFLMFS